MKNERKIMKNKKFWLPILTSLACLLGMIFAPNSVQAKELKNVISKYFNNSYLSAVSSLVKEEDISLEELKQLIQDVEK